MPQQHWIGQLPSDIVSKSKWGIDEKQISHIHGGKKTIDQVTRHLRNSIAHYRFKAFANNKNEIAKIEFEDYTDDTKTCQTFKATIPISSLRIFTEKLTTVLLNKIEKEK